MPFNYNRDTYAQILEEAKAILKAPEPAPEAEEDSHDAEDLDDLRADAAALAARFTDRAIYGTETVTKISILREKIGALTLATEDFHDLAADYREELDAAAEWYDVELPSDADDGDGEEDNGGAENPIFKEIKDAPDIFKSITLGQLLNYNLGKALLTPAGRSAYHQRNRPLTLATASLAAAAFMRDQGGAPPKGGPKGGGVAGGPKGGGTTPVTPTRPPASTPPAIPAPGGGGDELFVLITGFIGGGVPAQRELRKMLAGLHIDTLEELVKVAMDGDPSIGPGQHLRDLLVAAHPTRGPRIPSAEALDKLVQAAFDKINK